MKIIFATNNPNKVKEIRPLVTSNINIITLREAGINIDIPEPYDTIEENASGKSRTIFDLTATNCFSEDSGLEVLALNNEPGVNSAMYAGEDRSEERNIQKLLNNLADKSDRSARFKTVISLIIDGKETLFEGICEGQIISQRRGNQGFGYDPVFIPDGSDKTFAEMSMEEKTRYSHRAKATEKLVVFLNNL